MNPILLPHRRSIWGRRQSRPLTTTQRQAFDAIWPTVSYKLPEAAFIPLSSLFPSSMDDLWVEIGFGGGEHLAALAFSHPAIGFIGCEPFMNGMASLMVHIQNQSLNNIRVVKDDARLLLARLPDQSVGRIFVLFPDPWPKKRHNKRRIIQYATVEVLARILKPGGRVHMATDHGEYAQWMEEVMGRHPDFTLDLNGRTSVKDRPADWPSTRYEQKAIKQGRVPAYFTYVRL